MDMALLWLIVAIVGFSLSGVLFVASIFIFLKLKIPAVIGDLSGRTVAKQVKAIRSANEASGEKSHKSSAVNKNRGKLTKNVNDDRIDEFQSNSGVSFKTLDRTDSGQQFDTASSEYRQPSNFVAAEIKSTEVLSNNFTDSDIGTKRGTEILTEPRQTEVLTESRQTEVLAEPRQTEVLNQDYQTELLNEDVSDTVIKSGTTILNDDFDLPKEVLGQVSFKITRSLIVIHTDEII